ncbi:MAG: hypothetical protein ACRD38_00275 [Nitrososphaerales archaeon]
MGHYRVVVIPAVLGMLLLTIIGSGSIINMSTGQAAEVSQVEESNYIIFKNSTGTYAKNGKTGLIQFSNTTDSSTVIQDALNAVNAGGKVTLRNGTYLLNTGLVIKTETTLEGESKQAAKLKANAAIDTIKIDSGANAVVIRDLQIDQNSKTGTAILYDTPTGVSGLTLSRSVIDNVMIKNVPSGSWSIILDYIESCLLMNIQMIDVANGLLIDDVGSGRGGNSVLIDIDVQPKLGNTGTTSYKFVGTNLINAYHLRFYDRNISTGVSTALYADDADFNNIFGIQFEHFAKGIELVNSDYNRFIGGYMGTNNTSLQFGIKASSSSQGNTFQNLRLNNHVSSGTGIDDSGAGSEGNHYIGNKIGQGWSLTVSASSNSFFEKNTNYLDSYPLDNLTTDPSSLSLGEIWYRSDQGSLKYRDGSASRTVVGTDVTQTLTSKTLRAASNTITAEPVYAILTALGATLFDDGGSAIKRIVDDSQSKYAVLDFIDSATRESEWDFKVGDDIDPNASLTVNIYWFSQSQTTNDARWCVALATPAIGSAWDVAYGTNSCVNDTTDSTAKDINEATVTFTSPGIVADDFIKIRIQRDGGHTQDTLSGDARLVMVEVLWN